MNKSKKLGVISVDYLKEKVYPDLHIALMQLIDHVVKTEEVRKHQERLKKIKIFDKLEQRKTEKETLKQELGSEYVSSEDSMDWEELGIDKQEVEKFMKKAKEEEQPESGEQEESNDNEKSNAPKPKTTIDSLDKIQEHEEINEAEEEEAPNELQRMKEYLKRQREESLYNPLTHLAQLLRDVVNSK